MSSQLIERESDETKSLSKRHGNLKVKQMKHKEMKSDAKQYNKMRAKGEISAQTDDERDIFLPVKRNVCNHCGKGFISVKAKKDHVEDNAGPHGDDFKLWCNKPRCGCVYETNRDLEKHKTYHENLADEDEEEEDDEDEDEEEEE